MGKTPMATVYKSVHRVFLKRRPKNEDLRPKTPWTKTKTPWTKTKTPLTETKIPLTKTKTPWTETKTPWTKTKTPCRHGNERKLNCRTATGKPAFTAVMQSRSRHVILPRTFGKEGRNSSTLCAKTFMK